MRIGIVLKTRCDLRGMKHHKFLLENPKSNYLYLPIKRQTLISSVSRNT